jgi:hypothetical protein
MGMPCKPHCPNLTQEQVAKSAGSAPLDFRFPSFTPVSSNGTENRRKRPDRWGRVGSTHLGRAFYYTGCLILSTCSASLKPRTSKTRAVPPRQDGP